MRIAYARTRKAAAALRNAEPRRDEIRCLLAAFACSLVYAPDRLVGNVDCVCGRNHIAEIQDDKRSSCAHDVGNDSCRVTKKAAPRLFSRAVQKPPFLVLFGAELLDSGVEGICKIPEFLGRQFRSPIGQIPLLRNELVLDPLVFRDKLLGLALNLGQHGRTRSRLFQQPVLINCQDWRCNLRGNGTGKQAGARDEAREKQPRSAWKS